MGVTEVNRASGSVQEFYENALVLRSIHEDISEHKNPYLVILAMDTCEKILRHRGKDEVKIVGWSEENSLELMVDCFRSGRRLELVFEKGGTEENKHIVRVSEVCDDVVNRFPPSVRPFRLEHHIRWLFGSDS
jgi:hypothetical protein